MSQPIGSQPLKRPREDDYENYRSKARKLYEGQAPREEKCTVCSYEAAPHRPEEAPHRSEKRVERIPLRREYLFQVIRQEKKAEGRINSGPFRSLRENDEIEFFCQGMSARCLITGVKTYRTFQELVEKEGVKNLIPRARDIKEAVSIYESLPGYKERAYRNGIVALRIKLLSHKP